MTPRARWWLRTAGPGIVWLVFAVPLAVLEQWSAVVVCVGAAAGFVISTRSAIWLFRSGYFLGRGSELVDLERSTRGLPPTRPIGHMPDPWDTFPPWPDEDTPADSEPGHIPENTV